ncbi:MAG: hypothetical protein AAF298_05900 [Cyanobacteria bacterium P01_A01_bin.40]
MEKVLTSNVMSITAIASIYSPGNERSNTNINTAITITFFSE